MAAIAPPPAAPAAPTSSLTDATSSLAAEPPQPPVAVTVSDKPAPAAVDSAAFLKWNALFEAQLEVASVADKELTDTSACDSNDIEFSTLTEVRGRVSWNVQHQTSTVVARQVTHSTSYATRHGAVTC